MTLLYSNVSGYATSLYYRPQTKFAKVMFLHVSVCPRGRGVHGQVPPHRPGSPPGPGTPPRPGTPPWTRYTPRLFTHPPRAVHAGRYGQQAGGTHPTGMHSCLVINFLLNNDRHFIIIQCIYSTKGNRNTRTCGKHGKFEYHVEWKDFFSG